MADPRSGPSKRIVVDALVLAFAHSEAKEIVGTDALRTVLEVEYRELTASGKLELEALWELLEQQPGFEGDAAIPPMLVIKQWERRLGLEVVLPGSFDEISEGERARRIAEVKVPTPELRKLFRADLETSAKTGSRKNKTAKKERAPRPRLTAALGLVAIAGFSFAGYSLYSQCNRRAEWRAVSTAEFAGEIPLVRAERHGQQVGATLSDPKWLALPVEVRKAQLKRAIDELVKRDIRVLFIRDAAGEVRATVQISAKTGSVAYTFRRRGGP